MGCRPSDAATPRNERVDLGTSAGPTPIPSGRLNHGSQPQAEITSLRAAALGAKNVGHRPRGTRRHAGPQLRTRPRAPANPRSTTQMSDQDPRVSFDVAWLKQHEQRDWADRLTALRLSGTPLNVDAPDPQAPTADTPTQHDEPQVNWEERYTNLQPEFTRASQEAAKYRDLAERARAGDSAALRELTGYELDDQPEEPQYGEDPYDAKFAAHEARLAAQEQRWEEQQQAEQMRAIESHLEAGMAAIPDLNKDDHDWVALRALNSEALPNGMPDVQSAYEALQQRDLAAQKRWASTKRAPSPPVGQAGNQQPAFSEMTREQRAEYMAQRADSLED